MEETLSGIFGNTEFEKEVKTMVSQTTTTIITDTKVDTDEVYFSQISGILVPDMTSFRVSDDKIASAKVLIDKMKMLNYKYKSYIKLVAIYILNKNLNVALNEVNRIIDDLNFVNKIMDTTTNKDTDEYRIYDEAYMQIYSFYDLKQTILLLKAGFTQDQIDEIMESDNYLPIISEFKILWSITK